MNPAGSDRATAGLDPLKRRSGKRRRAVPVWSGALRTAFIAVLVVAVAYGVERLLGALVGFTPLIVFHAATAAATWIAGPAAGVLAALLSFLIGEREFFTNSLLSGADAPAVVQAVVYWIAALAIIAGLSVLRRALARASRDARRSERLAHRVRRRNEQSRQAAERYRALNEVAAAMLPALTTAQVRDLVLGPGALAADAVVAMLVMKEGDRLDVGCRGDCPDGLDSAVARAEPVQRALTGGASAWIRSADLAPDVAERSECDLWAVLPLAARDRRIGVLLLGYPAGPGVPDEYRTITELLAQQCTQALERARLYQEERSLRIEAQFGERQLGFLALASSALSATLDTTRSLAEVADIAATNLGGFCAIHIVEGEDRVRLAAGSFSGESGLVRFGGDEDRYALREDSPVGYPAVLACGEPQLVPELTEARLEEAAASPAHAERLLQLGLRSQICVPLIVRETVLGTITVASTEPGRRLAASELTLVEHVARRVAQAVDAARLYRTAVQASRAKSSFLAVMSHELRTPLNAILGYADLILMGVPAEVPAETRHQVERMRSSASHLLELVEDVLSFARAEAGRDRVRIETVVLEDVVAEAVGMVEPLATGKGLALRRSVPAGATMNTDRAKLIRILHNLLSNAAKFTPAGSIDVDVRIEGSEVVVAVRDTGIGIPQQHRERIFDPFWQVEQTPTRRFGGTGIGLGVARQLARLLGGDVVVESEVGKGSTFTLRVPARYEVLPPLRS